MLQNWRTDWSGESGGHPLNFGRGVSLQCLPQFPPCMKPAACGCACANLGPGCFFCLCPSSCGAEWGSGPPSALLGGGAAGDRLVMSLAVSSEPLRLFKCPLGAPTRGPGCSGVWALGKGLPSLLSPHLPATLRPSPVPMRVTPVSLFPLFPLYACACYQGGFRSLQVMLSPCPRVRVRTLPCPLAAGLELLLLGMLLPGKEAGSE